MKEIFLTNSVKFITKYNPNYSDDDLDKIKYGLEGLYLTFTKLLIIALISLILGIFKEVVLVLIFLNIIRYPAFGVHADKSITCLITSILTIVGLTFIMINTPINTFSKSIISFLCFIDYLLFAPADTVKRPLTNAKKRKYRKIASCIVSIIYIILIFLIKDELISNIILTALIIEAFMINPYIYKLLGMPYNNYKKIV
ncbi:MAG: accessory gene regulator B family protein [Bacilli bacterium]